MGAIVMVQVDPVITAAVRDGAAPSGETSVIDLSDPEHALAHIEQASGAVDALVLGDAIVEPIRLAQRAHLVNRDVAVLILSDPNYFGHLSRTVQFAPLLGDNVFCRPVEPAAAVSRAIQEVAEGSRQRRAHRLTLAALNRQIAATARLQIQPTHYLDRLLDYAPIGIVVVDAQGSVVDANRNARDLLGEIERDILGVPLANFFPSSEQDRLRSLLTSTPIPASQRSPAILSRRLRDEGEQFVEVTTAHLAGAAGAHGYLVLLADVTARATAEREQAAAEERLAFLVEASRVLNSSLDYEATLASLARLATSHLADWAVVSILEEDGSIATRALAHADPAQEDLLRESRRRRQASARESLALIDVLRSGRPVIDSGPSEPDTTREMERRALVPGSIMIAPIRIRERVAGAVTFAAGPGGRRYQEADLALAEELTGRAAIAIDNARLYQEARTAIQAREDFLSTASHEIKTPLTSVKVATQLLARRLDASRQDNEKVGHLVRQLQNEVGRLELLVRDLLDASRIQRGDIDLRLDAVDLVALARDILERFEHTPLRLDRHTLVLDAPEPVRGIWDPTLLDRVIANLVSNALKYSPDGGEVRVRVQEVDGQAEVAVSDQGIGIPAAEQHSLFQPFSRGATAQMHYGGTGLGLYIASRIIERHGGAITVNSAPEKGSTFTIRLPLETHDRQDDLAETGRS